MNTVFSLMETLGKLFWPTYSPSIAYIRAFIHEQIEKLSHLYKIPTLTIGYGTDPIAAAFNQHPIMLVGRFLFVLFLEGFLFFSLIFFRSLFSPEIFIWAMTVGGLLLLSILIRLYVSWEIGTDFITAREVILIEHLGIFRHTFERILLNEVKFFDLEQKGFWQSVLDCGDIYITSEMGPQQNIVLHNVWPVRKTFAALEKAISPFSLPPTL